MISSFKHFSSTLRRLTAFVFDIDGVLLKGKSIIPKADLALQHLYEDDKKTVKYPICLLTNGGGVTEAQKAEKLSSLLGVCIDEQQVVLCHTPMPDLTLKFGDKPILLSGKGDLLNVATSYGFSKLVTCQQLFQAMPTAVPITPSIHDVNFKEPCPVRDLKYGTKDDPFASVMVFTDPLDWLRDIQLITDVVTSNGVPGHIYPFQQDWPIEVYIGSQDLLWANEFPLPRYGLGAFSLAFQSLFKAYTGTLPKITHFGKPTVTPFRLAEKLLMKQAEALGGTSLEKIFMIGDNPAADIRGARNCGHPWTSVLVQTGVFKPGTNYNNNKETKDEAPDIISEDVFEFVTKHI